MVGPSQDVWKVEIVQIEGVLAINQKSGDNIDEQTSMMDRHWSVPAHTPNTKLV